MSSTNPPDAVPCVVNPLDYARQPSWLVRARQRWRGPILYLIAASICFAIREPVVARTKQLYWQWQCLNHQNIGKAVVNYYTKMPEEWNWYLLNTGLADNANQQFEPECVFLGRMTRPDGTERLVRLHEEFYITNWNGKYPVTGDYEISITACVIQPTTILHAASRVDPGSKGTSDCLKIPLGQGGISMNGAVADPANPSHLTILTTQDDQPARIIDVFLDNSDSIQFQWRTPPSTQSSRPANAEKK